MIIEYKMDRDFDGRLRVPSWIESGGFLPNAGDYTFIGFSPSVREYKIPDSVTTLTATEAKSRSQTIHSTSPYKHFDGSDMTTEEVDTYVQNIIDENDFV
jgi:hypothetical protein